ncbi:flagellar motor protein [Paenibacillus polymyxa]|uniref:Chemotaxis protein motA Motility protein A n=1 Tax=Paenibacillus polymyxa TaxID=1406 RepID=A0A378Y5E2_PAEPO|nr:MULTISPECIES: flagellar motor protein [Paenibacillus]KAF6621095.1 flagellar motor protein [Paenibacillus sp. EKM101P]KAF6622399.1 flagellar motor protein [Paenibacillus sp. EKM102P]KAF6632247.1 flagellar motor protein [Paenibacillus sp. EKM10P]KAF6647003.1 flagellar motor protein [Paenibacillus sp. EKM11P]MBE7899024.1 flagellar motor protein [Paenibacillus polymyxa]
MDITIVLGIIAGIIALIGGFLWEGGEFTGLLQGTSALIVFGGTFAAVVISYPASKLKTIPTALRMAFSREDNPTEQYLEDLVSMAATSRRSGVLALERISSEHPNAFLREGLQLVIDGTEQEQIKQILELELDAIGHKHEGYAKIFESAGGYAPTMGIIGTVMGLIHVLGSLTEPTALGPSIAVAFIATLYGVASANLIFLPIASKIRAASESEIITMDLLLQGILAIQNGENPKLVRKKLEFFIRSEQNIDRKPPRRSRTESATPKEDFHESAR